MYIFINDFFKAEINVSIIPAWKTIIRDTAEVKGDNNMLCIFLRVSDELIAAEAKYH